MAAVNKDIMVSVSDNGVAMGFVCRFDLFWRISTVGYGGVAMQIGFIKIAAFR